MLTIGLAGGSGSGKGTVCAFFEELGFKAIDTDAVYRDLTKPNGECISALVREFGDDVLGEDGSINRKALSSIVFFGEGNEYRRNRLHKITHDMILNRVRLMLDEFRKEGIAYAIVDAPLLFESGFHNECNLIISVLSDEKSRVISLRYFPLSFSSAQYSTGPRITAYLPQFS